MRRCPGAEKPAVQLVSRRVFFCRFGLVHYPCDLGGIRNPLAGVEVRWRFCVFFATRVHTHVYKEGKATAERQRRVGTGTGQPQLATATAQKQRREAEQQRRQSQQQGHQGLPPGVPSAM
jgi:hypothetical protein